MYKAIVRFVDLDDSRYLYEAGDDYPRVGLDVSKERIEILTSWRNQSGRPLIKYVADAEAKPQKSELTIDDVEVAKPKRKSNKKK